MKHLRMKLDLALIGVIASVASARESGATDTIAKAGQFICGPVARYCQVVLKKFTPGREETEALLRHARQVQ